MKPLHTFIAIPALPEKLTGLRDLAYNLHWSWDPSAIALFRRLDADLWEVCGHNPVLMLGMINQGRLEEVAWDDGFLSHLEGLVTNLKHYMSSSSTWFKRRHEEVSSLRVAYFSLEFGLTECLSIFAGGLGVLAGDHLKSASDLGLPLVGVGLLYQQGYFHQRLNEAGWQQEDYTDNDFHNLPITLERNPTGEAITVEVQLPGRPVTAQVWRAQAGRVPLYLLDTNLPVNRREDRDITDQLYGGDKELRIQQEILLGIGGYRALEALGLHPTVYHMNEGHSAFLALERILKLMEANKVNFFEARQAAGAGLVFTTHTPVSAGHDYFSSGLMDRYFGEYRDRLGLNRRDFLALGRQNPDNDNEDFCMTVLALRMAAYSNGVSKLHGQVSRRMWQNLWPGVPESEIPITSVTNGIHHRSWISREMNQLYERYLGEQWDQDPDDPLTWERAGGIPAEELWRTHERRRERLVALARRRLREQLVRRGAAQAELLVADEVLDPEALTIGFSRRFATYKRATLLLRDPDRLARILTDAQRPVQVLFAGKAHPHDDPGKELIQKIIKLSRQEPFRRRLVFLENYDVGVSRYLVQGCDVWLNNPLRPLEASGTSGMKAAVNGVLNVSTLDGWWDEAYRPEVGWAIGRGETYDNAAYQDQVEAEALYELLEVDIVPTFYDRGRDGLPRRWIERMKASIRQLCLDFNTHRMVSEYAERFYVPASAAYRHLIGHNLERARKLAAWKSRVERSWPQVKVIEVQAGMLKEVQVGQTFSVKARVALGDLTPEDVSVQLYLGMLDARNEITNGRSIAMQCNEQEREATFTFEAAAVTSVRSGLHGFTVRVLPQHPDLVPGLLPGLITWAQ